MKKTFFPKLIKFITFSFLIQYIANFGLTWLEFIENNNHAFTNVNKKNIFQILVKFYSKIFEIENKFMCNPDLFDECSLQKEILVMKETLQDSLQIIDY
jgi:hypothetical protein